MNTIQDNTGYLTKQPKKMGLPAFIGKANICGAIYGIRAKETTPGCLGLVFEYEDEVAKWGGHAVTKMVTVRRKSPPKGKLRNESLDRRTKVAKAEKPVRKPKGDVVCRTCTKLEKCILTKVKPKKDFICYRPR